jgi:thioredoxin reductase
MTFRTDLPRLAILGAGPVGLETALYATALGLPVTVYERGRVGEHLHRWGHVRLFSPFGMNSTPLGRSCIRSDLPDHDLPPDGALLTGRQHIAAYLEPLARTSLLADTIRTETTVLHVGRKGLLKEDGTPEARRVQPFRLLVRSGNRERMEEADVVLDCTGTYERPRGLGDGGIPAAGEPAARPHIAGGLEDVLGERRPHYADRTILVLGAGYSAATTVCNLAALAEQHPATWVIWLARGPATQPIRRVVNDPLRERDQLAVRANTLATRGEGNVEFHAQAVVEAVEGGPDRGFKVSGRRAGKATTWEVERIIANLGYTPNNDLYRELQVAECPATLGPLPLAAMLQKYPGADGWTLPAPAPAALRNPEPNFYILGAKSFGRSSSFFVRTGFEQVRDVFTLITGKSALDLYRKR